ncbi:MAG TPA: hypothetical protein VGE74_25430 [Gemmata sp.]
MSLLTGPEIDRLAKRPMPFDGRPILPHIDVSPWPGTAGPNSLDVHLSSMLLVYDLPRDRYEWVTFPDGCVRFVPVLDSRKPNRTKPIPFTDEGFVFVPGVLYLGCTREVIECHGLVPYIDGRSSVGRLGVAIHKTAGRGDDGWVGALTLEISVEEPTRLYPGDRIGQLTFHTLVGERRPYLGRYQMSSGPVASRMHLPDGETS